VGIEGIGRRLFQAGTHPPHYQYFTRRSLESFVSQIGLKPLRSIDDLDFEPQELVLRPRRDDAGVAKDAPRV